MKNEKQDSRELCKDATVSFYEIKVVRITKAFRIYKIDECCKVRRLGGFLETPVVTPLVDVAR